MGLISVIVPTQNRPALLEEALRSLGEQTLAPVEIIVVDDASTPPVDADTLVARHGPTLRVIRNDSARGLAYSRNLGVENASGDYVFHLDDDDLLAPTALAEAHAVLAGDPGLDVVFLGAQGFGPNAGHFNRVQPEAVARVIALGGGRRDESGLVQFGGDLIQALLHTVPIAFQRVMLRRETWHAVSALRRRAYRLDPAIADDDAAKRAINGPLRDSEWALYAGAVCHKSALLDRPLYLQRCAGQGYSSQPANKELHLRQSLLIKNQLWRAAQALPELAPWRRAIRDCVAAAHFDAAYAYFNSDRRQQSWGHLRQALSLRPRLHYAKFALRTLLPRLRQGEPAH